MKNLQEEQKPIDAKIVYALVESIPEDWNMAILQVDYLADANQDKYSLRIKNPNLFISKIYPVEDVYIAIRELSLIFKKHGTHWKRVIYTISLDSDNDWNYDAKFEY
jgi:hypothetical protein